MQVPTVSTPSLAVRDAESLTTAERLIWTGQKLDPGSPLYNMALSFDLRGDLNLDALTEAFRRLVEREPVLRTVFEEHGGNATRIVKDELPIRLERLDWPETDVDDAEVLERLRTRTRVGMPLDGPLTDACVVRRRPDRHIVYLNQHHLITDAWSTGILYRRWADTYQEVAGLAAPVAQGPAFADHLARERELRGTPQCAQAIAHWNQTSEGFSSDLSLYGHRGRGSGRTARVRVPLGATRSAALRALAATAPFRALTPQQSRYHVFATVLLA